MIGRVRRVATAVALVGAGALGIANEADAQVAPFGTRITNNNKVGLTTTNYGFYGNNFSSRSPSMEYPLGSSYEHLIRAGLWIGGTTINDSLGQVTRVSVGTMDGSVSESAVDRVEYIPRTVITETSRLPNNRFFDPDAVSEQDFFTIFTDDPGRNGQQNIENHLPLGIDVQQEIYNWSFAAFADLIIVHLSITARKAIIQDLYVGMTAELASGPKDEYGTWPPSSTSGGSLGSWFSKKLIEYDPARRLIGEHYCLDFTNGLASCDFDVTPPWAGIMLLGTRPDTISSKIVGFKMWNWSPGDTARSFDRQLYELISSPHVTPADSLLPANRSNDPVTLISTGPFDLLVDSTIVVDFAFVAGETKQQLLEAADFAQLAFDFNYVVPTPPPSPRLKLVSEEARVDIYWDDSPELVSDETSPQPGGLDFQGYRVYLGEDRNDLRRIAQFDKVDTTGFDTGFDAIRLPEPVIIEGDSMHYRYTVSGLKDGFKNFLAVTSYDTGDQQVPSLESGVSQNKGEVITSPSPESTTRSGVTVFPNPYKAEAIWDAGQLVRDHYLWFANLPRRCRIKVFTLSGDLVFETDFDGDTYDGSNARGIYDPSQELDIDQPSLSGGMFGWDLISREGQAIVSGLYIYTVQDRDTDEIQRGKFLVLKSDREGF